MDARHMDTRTLHQVLSHIAATAALAPSSHNCQPWAVQCLARTAFEALSPPADETAGDWTHALVVGIDRRRALSALPALAREMHLSVGGFASLLLNLLRLSGFGVQTQWLPEGWRDGTPHEPVLALLLTLPGTATTGSHPLWQWIAQRHTARGPYLRGPLRPPDEQCLPHRLADGDAALHWRYVHQGDALDALGGFYRRHAAQDFRHGAAWHETYRHLDFSARARNASGTGMNIQSLLGPLPAWQRRLHQLAWHPLAMRLAGPLGLHRRVGREVESLVRSSPAIAYLCADRHAPDARRLHLLAGERITELWLGATREGQSMHPLSVALQHPQIEQALRALLVCEHPVLFIARLGTPATRSVPAYRYRRAPEAFCAFEPHPADS